MLFVIFNFQVNIVDWLIEILFKFSFYRFCIVIVWLDFHLFAFKQIFSLQTRKCKRKNDLIPSRSHLSWDLFFFSSLYNSITLNSYTVYPHGMNIYVGYGNLSEEWEKFVYFSFLLFIFDFISFIKIQWKFVILLNWNFQFEMVFSC